jgi:hypothetical protein
LVSEPCSIMTEPARLLDDGVIVPLRLWVPHQDTAPGVGLRVQWPMAEAHTGGPIAHEHPVILRAIVRKHGPSSETSHALPLPLHLLHASIEFCPASRHPTACQKGSPEPCGVSPNTLVLHIPNRAMDHMAWWCRPRGVYVLHLAVCVSTGTIMESVLAFEAEAARGKRDAILKCRHAAQTQLRGTHEFAEALPQFPGIPRRHCTPLPLRLQPSPDVEDLPTASIEAMRVNMAPFHALLPAQLPALVPAPPAGTPAVTPEPAATAMRSSLPTRPTYAASAKCKSLGLQAIFTAVVPPLPMHMQLEIMLAMRQNKRKDIVIPLMPSATTPHDGSLPASAILAGLTAKGISHPQTIPLTQGCHVQLHSPYYMELIVPWTQLFPVIRSPCTRDMPDDAIDWAALPATTAEFDSCCAWQACGNTAEPAAAAGAAITQRSIEAKQNMLKRTGMLTLLGLERPIALQVFNIPTMLSLLQGATEPFRQAVGKWPLPPPRLSPSQFINELHRRDAPGGAANGTSFAQRVMRAQDFRAHGLFLYAKRQQDMVQSITSAAVNYYWQADEDRPLTEGINCIVHFDVTKTGPAPVFYTTYLALEVPAQGPIPVTAQHGPAKELPGPPAAAAPPAQGKGHARRRRSESRVSAKRQRVEAHSQVPPSVTTRLTVEDSAEAPSPPSWSSGMSPLPQSMEADLTIELDTELDTELEFQDLAASPKGTLHSPNLLASPVAHWRSLSPGLEDLGGFEDFGDLGDLEDLRDLRDLRDLGELDRGTDCGFGTPKALGLREFDVEDPWPALSTKALDH